MLKEYRMQAILGIWGGAAFSFIGYLISSLPQASYGYFGRMIMAGGYILFVCGCFMYSKGKGHSWYFGILGIFGPLGLLILYVLRDKSKMILKKRGKLLD